MTDNESELRAEVVTFRCKEAYLYSVPPASTIGHRAETWNVDKWLQEVAVQVITRVDDCWVRLLDFKSGELFAECPIPNDKPLQTAVDPVVDSSRYFVLRLVDHESKRHAFMGLGFREREQASNFNTALYEHTQYLRRKAEAFEMRQAYESADANVADTEFALPRQDLSLKPGQTLKLKLSNSKLAGDPSTPPQRRPGLMTKSGMPSPFTPGGALQIPVAKAASRLDPPSGSSLPMLPPPPSPEDHVTSGIAQTSGTSADLGTMRVSMDQLSVQERDGAADEAPAEPMASADDPAISSKAKTGSLQTAKNMGSQPEAAENITADDWGEFLGDDPAE